MGSDNGRHERNCLAESSLSRIDELLLYFEAVRSLAQCRRTMLRFGSAQAGCCDSLGSWAREEYNRGEEEVSDGWLCKRNEWR